MAQGDIAGLIQKKRDGGCLEPDEIRSLIDGYVGGTVPDYQMAALCMAIFFQGMNVSETTRLTEQMLASGTTLSWSDFETVKVDKHSTGGVGDKVSIVLAPLLAACGLAVPMVSGRGLGATGGTLDKLESIDGFRTDLSVPEIIATTERVGCVITGTTPDLAPADRKLYALRDVTATVESIGLITASIMSKKLAESLDALILDVKTGSGAFMKSKDRARQLAQSLVDTGNRMGVKTKALLTDMNQPLGRMVGNAVEVAESIDVLSGRGPKDVVDIVLALGAELLVLAGRQPDTRRSEAMLKDKLGDGAAMEKFQEMVAAQGGNLEVARRVTPPRELAAETAGWVTSIDTEAIGRSIILMGGGRRKMGDPIDHSVGLEMLVRVGDRVDARQPLFRLFTRGREDDPIESLLRSAVHVSVSASEPLPLVLETVEAEP